MHIPDGYLSPATCAALYAGAAPFWLVALRRVQATFRARTMPLLSLLSAFSFVVMMFNLPLPGGTTGHAVGMGVAAVLLGPWASMLALSVALLIQAVFFGDGGVTTYGANCLNMAVVGSLVAHAVYRTLTGRSAVAARRRVWAAAFAGYAAINVSALLAAVEFGIQPALFHDAAGSPLYAPYPLHIAVPAMMLGHLTVAGLAEGVIAGGLVAWLQKANPLLLQATARPGENPWRLTRALWGGLAALMIATPLGLLAAGTAWGEWKAQDFRDQAARQEIAAASREVAPPIVAPAGLERLASLWTAPLPDYAPTFLRSASFGYMMSAMFGAGLITGLFLLFSTFTRKCTRTS
ncbi:MAG TPA: cobalt transporter CbiM [Chthoniobacteraceae bacterium]|jgi:cobalt/nickel transport system permease protein|nr:cobalt transporter CbiM [Chthoniobacteraceae bacterium]